MSIIRITEIFTLEIAHVLWNYDGLCKNIHGHSYKLYVTIKGKPVIDANHPKIGMIIDFVDIKSIVKSLIINEFDHTLIIPEKAVNENTKIDNQIFGNTKIVNFQPTVENLVEHFAFILKNKIPENIKLFSLKLYETETSYAEWFADDN